MASRDTYGIHLVAGGVAGTVGAVLTCPLEVVKTRLQSSVATFHPVYIPSVGSSRANLISSNAHNVNYSACSHVGVHTQVLHGPGTYTGESALQLAHSRSAGLYYCLKFIVKNEGIHGLFKGLGPNLVGVAPSRAIYFFTYANAKRYLNGQWTPETPIVHVCSAMAAGLTACTATNPIWLIKTRLQLDQKKNDSLTCRQCIRDIYKSAGFRGFYKGMSASYVGVTETVIHFVIYESIKAHLLASSQREGVANTDRTWVDFLRFMFAGACSKTMATCIAYPHEVVRTRLREEGTKYRSFFQTLFLVAREEGRPGLYRGLVTQLVRQIPNTACMMATYELVVYLFQCWKRDQR